jgi:hypothetical protein
MAEWTERHNVRNQVKCGRRGDGVSPRRVAATCALLEVIITLMELLKGPMLFRIERRTSEKIALEEANKVPATDEANSADG